jgi:hypothetical protein
LSPPSEVIKLTYKNIQVVERRHRRSCRYGLGLELGDRHRHQVALGHERHGWSRELGHAVLVGMAVHREPATVGRG